jgi:hypothetical protein
MATIPYTGEIRCQGRIHQVHVPQLRLPICASCGEKSFTADVDEQINAAFRRRNCDSIQRG